jgi:hypothetical protein
MGTDYGDFVAMSKAVPGMGVSRAVLVPSSSQIQNDLSRPRLTRSMSWGSGTAFQASMAEEIMQVPRPLPVSALSSMPASSASSGSPNLSAMTESTRLNMAPSTSSQSSSMNVNMNMNDGGISGSTQQLPFPSFKTVLGAGLPAPISSPSGSGSAANKSASSAFNRA